MYSPAIVGEQTGIQREGYFGDISFSIVEIKILNVSWNYNEKKTKQMKLPIMNIHIYHYINGIGHLFTTTLFLELFSSRN